MPPADPRMAPVLASLAARHPVDEREAHALAAVAEALGRLPAPFDRDADPTHVTGSGIVVGPRGVLLHRHRRLGLWLQPGGHLEPGETPWDAAMREAAEETGLTVRFADAAAGGNAARGDSVGDPAGAHRPGDPAVPLAPPSLVHVDVHPGGRGHTHLDLRYLLAVDGDDTPWPPEGESQEVAWFSWDDAIATADPGLRGALVALRPA